MATIGSYTAASTIDASNDYLLIQTSGVYKKINRTTLLNITGSPVGTTDSQSLTNKTLDNTNTITLKDTLFTLQDDGDTTKQARFQLSGITTATIRTYTLPNASVTLASLTGTESLTNKTITSPTITGGTYDNGTITVDSISGHSVATTVTVANLQIANGVLNSANAVTSTSIAAGAVQPQALVSGTGSGWALTSWVPVWTNLTVGNAVVTAKYVQVGKVVIGRLSLAIGTTTAIGTDPNFTLPITAVSYPNISNIIDVIGEGGLLHFGGSPAHYAAQVKIAATTTATLYYLNSTANSASITASVPWAWANGDKFTVQFWYEAA